VPGPDLRALRSLRRLRRAQTDEARRALGEALAREAVLAARDEALRREIDEARRLTGDFDREAFSAWLTRMRTEQARLSDALRTAEAGTETARTGLARRRVAETAAQDALATEVAALEAASATAIRRRWKTWRGP
jgi:hypothetical protein